MESFLLQVMASWRLGSYSFDFGRTINTLQYFDVFFKIFSLNMSTQILLLVTEDFLLDKESTSLILSPGRLVVPDCIIQLGHAAHKLKTVYDWRQLEGAMAMI